jgi:hypothetical protein
MLVQEKSGNPARAFLGHLRKKGGSKKDEGALKRGPIRFFLCLVIVDFFAREYFDATSSTSLVENYKQIMFAYICINGKLSSNIQYLRLGV